MFAAGNFPPYISDVLPEQGPAVAVLKEAYKLQGIDAELIFLPSKRAFLSAEKDKHYAGTTFWFYKPERAETFLYSEPVYDTVWAFFHRKDLAFDWQSMEDLKGLKVGAVSGYRYSDEFDIAVKSGALDVDWSSSNQMALTKLAKGRIDIFPIDINTGYFLLNQMAVDTKAVIHHPKPVTQQSSYLLINKSAENSEALIKQFNAGLQVMKASGRYQQIFKKAGLKTH